MTDQPANSETPSGAAEQLRAAIGLHQRGQLTEAQAIYERLLRLDPGHADALHLLGLIAYQQRQLGDAVALIGRAIAASPGNAAFHANRGIVLHELKQLDAAIADYDRAIAVKPDYAAAYNNRGNARQELNQFDAAIADYGQAVAISPDYAEAYYNRGNALREQGKLEAAVADYTRAIACKPNYAAAHNNRGNALQELKRLDAALADFDKAIAIRPDDAAAYSNRGNARKELKQLAAAIADYDKAIALKPDHAGAYANRGNARQELKQLDAAIADYDRAVTIKPDYAEAYYNRGNARQKLKQPDAAMADYDNAIAITPDYAEAYGNRGVARRELKQPDAALADFDKAIALKPDYAEAYYNRANARRELGKVEAVMADFDKAIALRPDFASAYLNKALALLAAGELERGFELYEWRWKNRDLNMPRSFAQPLWLGGEPLRGKKILLHSEQGLGDTIHFCRYASLAARAGAHAILQVPKTLVALLQSLDGVSRIVAEGEPLPDFDYHCPLLSLPLAFKTRLDTIPDPTPYLQADEAKARDWRERIGARKKLKVGVVWSCGFRAALEGWGDANDRNIPLDMFARALSAIDAQFFSLQKGEPAESEIRGRELAYWPRGNFHNFAGDINDFSDTAALIAHLDLVLSVDTSTAHLAAALGKPTWIFERFDPDWRWLLHRDDSPWYRTVKLYRQDKSQDWAPVLRRVAGDVTQLAARHPSASGEIVR